MWSVSSDVSLVARVWIFVVIAVVVIVDVTASVVLTSACLVTRVKAASANTCLLYTSPSPRD